MDTSGPFYEIRTYREQYHASLTMIAKCPNDIAAIVMARNFIRKGEGVEVWRDDSIVYRLEPRKTKYILPSMRRKPPVSIPGLGKRLRSLKTALPLANQARTFPAGQQSLIWVWFKLLGGRAKLLSRPVVSIFSG